MDSTDLYKTRAHCTIDALPGKLRLRTSRVNRIIRQKGTSEEASIFEEDDVLVRYQDDKNDNFQLYLRAGMKEKMKEILAPHPQLPCSPLTEMAG